MDPFDKLFIHLSKYRVIVCKKCRFAVVPGQIASHIRVQHPHIKPDRRRAIVEAAHRFANVAARPADAIYPNINSPAVAQLPVYRDGLQCQVRRAGGQICGYICRDKRVMQRHQRNVHQWVNPQGRGRPEGGREQRPLPWNTNVHCQQFFKTEAGQQYFPVQDDQGQAQGERTEEPSPDSNVLVQQMVDYTANKKAEHEQSRQIEDVAHRIVANPWLHFTQWPHHLSGFRPEELAAYVRPAVDEEGEGETEEEGEDNTPGLADACQATRQLIRHAFAISKPQIVGRVALEYVNRRECGATLQEKPFYGEQQVKTIRKYSGWWVKILRYIWQTANKERRPGYHLTREQGQKLSAVQQAAIRVEEADGSNSKQRRQRQQLVQAVLEFWVAMFDHHLKDNEFKSGIISGLAVLGYSQETQSWMPAFNYTPILAAIITTMRAIVVYRAWKIRTQDIRQLVRAGKTQDEAQQTAPSVYEGVKEMVDRFMTLTQFHGHPTPMDRIFHQKTYGMKIRYTTKAEGRVIWQGERILIDKIDFTIDDIRSVVHGLNETVRQRLINELLLYPADDYQVTWKPTGLPQFELQQLFDNPAELSEGFSFIHDRRNTWEVDGEQWMWKRVFENVESCKHFIVASSEEGGIGSIKWNTVGVERYFRQVRRFKEELMALIHMSAGAPARATELMSIQHKNGPQTQSQRGVFIDDGMVAFVTTYHKGFGASQRMKLIHRYVPEEVGELVVYYLWLVEPFVRSLRANVRDEYKSGPWIWEPQPEDVWEDTVDVEDEPEDDHQGEDNSETEWSDNGEEWLDGVEPTAAEGEPDNIDGFWDTNRVRRVMYRETESRIGVKIGVALWRNVYPAIQRQLSQTNSVREALDNIYQSQPAVAVPTDSIDNVRANQAGHSREVEEMVYGLLVMSSPFATATEQARYRMVSVDWHRILHFTSTQEEDRRQIQTREHKQVEIQDKQARAERIKRIQSIDVKAQLKGLCGSEAVFRGIQRPALDAIIARAPRVLAVMRTGGGKSMLFTIPAMANHSGVTVVIVPTISLRQDLFERCERASIPCAEWNGQRPPYHARIVLVTPESAATSAFSRFIDEKRTAHQLDRIVIDECHVVLESTKANKWRPKVLELCEMARKDVPVLYLTATLPPSVEGQFFHAIGVRETEIVQFREATTRPNVAYQVVPYERDREDEEVQAIVERLKEKYAAPGQVVVYCKRVVQAQRLAEVLGCSVYHRKAGTAGEKKAVLQRLTQQKERVFTATNALGLGVDAPCIRAVIHVGIREQVKQYAQESGRAGRDGFASEAIIMRAVWQGRDGQTKTEQGWQPDPAMKEFLKGESCRRIVLDRHMDGRSDRLGCEVGEERCDICEGAPRGRKRQRVVVQNGGGVEGSDVEGDSKAASREDDDCIQVSTKRVRVSRGPVKEEDGQEERRQIEEERRRQDEAERRRQVEQEVEQEQAVYARIRQQQRDGRVESADVAEAFERQLSGWQNRCCICWVQGRTAVLHIDWRTCPINEKERRIVEKCRQAVEGISFENYAQCSRCSAPQAICHMWESHSRQGSRRYRRRQDGHCQFAGVVYSAAAAVLALREDEAGAFIDQQIEQGEVVVADRGEQWDQWKVYLGQKVEFGGIEMSGLCRLLFEMGSR